MPASFWGAQDLHFLTGDSQEKNQLGRFYYMRAQQPEKKTFKKNEEKHKSRAGQVAVTFSLFLSFVYIGGRTGLD